MTIEKVKKFHIDNNYYVNVEPISEMCGCYVSFPPNLLHNLDPVVYTYLISDDCDNIEIFTTTQDKTTSKTINTQRINARLLILEDILLKATQRDMSKDLICIQDGKVKGNVLDVIHVKMTPEDLKLETELCKLFLTILEGGEVTEIDSVLFSSYEQLQECFENGGL